jgi:hypothetical protein
VLEVLLHPSEQALTKIVIGASVRSQAGIRLIGHPDGWRSEALAAFDGSRDGEPAVRAELYRCGAGSRRSDAGSRRERTQCNLVVRSRSTRSYRATMSDSCIETPTTTGMTPPAPRVGGSGRHAVRRALAISVLALATALSITAHADPSTAAIAGAKSLVGEGRKLRAAGRLQEARERFESAWLLIPTPIIGLDLGTAREALGLWIEARAILLEAAALPPIANESAESLAARDEARRMATDLEARIPTLAVTIQGAGSAAKVVVNVDGAEVPEAEVAAPRKVNPGKHAVVAQIGERLQRVDIDVAEREAKTATIVFPPIEAPPPRVTVVDAPPRVTVTSPFTYIGFSVAGAGIVIGTVTGVVSIRKSHDVTTACAGFDNQCPASLQGDYDSARRWGNVSTVSFIIGGAGVALGVYGLFNRETVSRPASGAASISLSIGVGSLGIRGAF